MNLQREQYSVLIKALLPKELFEYFEIVKVETSEKVIDVYLDELNQPPILLKEKKLISKGFHPAISIQDFPIRRCAVFLHVRRRKWQIVETGNIVSNSWDTTAQGTRYTKDFASFLKGLLG